MSVADQDIKTGIVCPKCGCPDHRVLQTRKLTMTVDGRSSGTIRRDRHCQNDQCGHRFWTTERIK